MHITEIHDSSSRYNTYPRYNAYNAVRVLAHIYFAILDMLQYLVHYLVQYFGMLVYYGIYILPLFLRHLREALESKSNASLRHVYGAFYVCVIDKCHA